MAHITPVVPFLATLLTALAPGRAATAATAIPQSPAVAAAVTVVGPGTWTNEGGDLLQSTVVKDGSAILFGEPSWSDYDLVVQGRTERGSHGFKVLFHATATDTFEVFAIGNYFNRGSDLSQVRKGAWSRADGLYRESALDLAKWHEIRLEVRGAKVRCFQDGVLQFERSDPNATRGRVGLATWDAAVRFRGLKITQPGGAVLQDRMPLVPGSVPDDSPVSSEPRLEGPWFVTYRIDDKEVTCDYRFAGDLTGSANAPGEPPSSLRATKAGSLWLVRRAGHLERWRSSEGRFLVEQWDGTDVDLATAPPARVGVAERGSSEERRRQAAEAAAAGAKPKPPARRTYQDQSKQHFLRASRPWGGPPFQLVADGVQTPMMLASWGIGERNALLLSPTELGSTASLHVELQGKTTRGALVGMVFGAKDASDCYIVDIRMNDVDWEIRLYRHRDGQTLVELAKQEIHLLPAEITQWWDLDVKVRGSEVTIALGDRAKLQHKASEPITGAFGPYVSGYTTALEPFVLRNLHVEGARPPAATQEVEPREPVERVRRGRSRRGN